MADCIFCMLANHEIPTSVVYETTRCFALRMRILRHRSTCF